MGHRQHRCVYTSYMRKYKLKRRIYRTRPSARLLFLSLFHHGQLYGTVAVGLWLRLIDGAFSRMGR